MKHILKKRRQCVNQDTGQIDWVDNERGGGGGGGDGGRGGGNS